MQDELQISAEAAAELIDPQQAVGALKIVEADLFSLALPVRRLVAAEKVEAEPRPAVGIEPRVLRVLRTVAVDQKGDAFALACEGVVEAAEHLAARGADVKSFVRPCAQSGCGRVPPDVVGVLMTAPVEKRREQRGTFAAEGVAVKLPGEQQGRSAQKSKRNQGFSHRFSP